MANGSGPSTVGGFTTRSGRSVLVTPSGQEVGSTTPIIYSGGGSSNRRRYEEAERRAAAAESARIEAARKAAEEAARKKAAAEAAAKRAAEKIAKQIQSNRYKKIVQDRKRIAQLIVNNPASRAAQRAVKKISKIARSQGEKTSKAFRRDFESLKKEYDDSVAERNKLLRKQEKVNKARAKIDKPLTPAERKSLGPVRSVLETQARRAAANKKVKDLTVKEKAILFRAGIRESVQSALIGAVELPGTAAFLVKNPTQIKKLPGALKESAKEFGSAAQISPTYAVGRIGGELVLMKGSSAAIKQVSKGGTKVLGKTVLKEVKKNKLGVGTIKNVPKVGEIEIVRTRNSRLNADIKKLVKDVDEEKLLKPKPKLARANTVEKKVLDIVKKRGDAVTGSYARETLVKKKFARKHKDLDILTDNRPKLMKDIKKALGKGVTFKKLKNSIEVKYRGKTIADLVKYKKGEAGFAKKYGYVNVNGVKVVRPRAILGGKLTKLKQTKFTRRFAKDGKLKTTKTIKDIKKLSGGKIDPDIPGIRGGFGYTKKELDALVGRKGPLVTGLQDPVVGKGPAVDILTKKIIKTGKFSPKEIKLKRFLYASPPVKGKGQLRTSRLGLSQGEASILDLIRGKGTLKKPKPTVYVFPNEKIYKASGKLTKKKLGKTPKGFVVPKFSSELEVVLGSPYSIKKGKTLARVNIEGNIVPIVELKKVKLSKGAMKLTREIENKRLQLAKKLVKKAKSKKEQLKLKKESKKLLGDVSKKERQLVKKLRKETGIKYDPSYGTKGKKYFSVKKRIAAIGLRGAVSKSPRVKRNIGRRKALISPNTNTKRRPTRSTPPSSPPRRSPPSRTPPRSPSSPSSGRSTRRASKTSRSIPVRTKRKKKAERQLKLAKGKQARRVKRSSPTQGYDVLVKSKGKFVKVNRTPLSQSNARNRLSFVLDNSISQSGKITPVKKVAKLGNVKSKERTYYSRTKRKFRNYKIKSGKKKTLKGTRVIEKRKNAIDTRGEKRQLTVSKLVKREGLLKSSGRKKRRK